MANYSHEPRGGAAMSFAEIGSELGICEGAARNLYASGMRKLHYRRRTPAFQNLVRLVQAKAMLQ
jgi:DNA-binding NarL/FixJ family response regulator